METYQAIYDAVRSRISGFDGQALIDRIAQQFDFSMYATQLNDVANETLHEQQRPSVLFRPSISIDGNQWCALYGDNLQDGIAGFGESPNLAMRDFDKNWNDKINGF